MDLNDFPIGLVFTRKREIWEDPCPPWDGIVPDIFIYKFRSGGRVDNEILDRIIKRQKELIKRKLPNKFVIITDGICIEDEYRKRCAKYNVSIVESTAATYQGKKLFCEDVWKFCESITDNLID